MPLKAAEKTVSLSSPASRGHLLPWLVAPSIFKASNVSLYHFDIVSLAPFSLIKDPWADTGPNEIISPFQGQMVSKLNTLLPPKAFTSVKDSYFVNMQSPYCYPSLHPQPLLCNSAVLAHSDGSHDLF